MNLAPWSVTGTNALIHLAEKGLECLSMSDFFHAMHDLMALTFPPAPPCISAPVPVQTRWECRCLHVQLSTREGYG